MYIIIKPLLLTFLSFLLFNFFSIGNLPLFDAANKEDFAGSNFVVTNTNDFGPGSLRQAITDANESEGVDTIIFNIGSGHQVVYPFSPLPEITSPVIIDGTTQPGYSGSPLIEINGVNTLNSSSNSLHGLFITAGNSTVKGLNINRFVGSGIALITLGDNVIEGNFIGTDITGTLRPGYQGDGIRINYSDNNLIGGTTPSSRNIISGNNGPGIVIYNSLNNQISGNFIGTDAAGNQSLFNRSGITISGENSTNNITGGNSPEQRNIISGNQGSGIFLADGFSNIVAGNYIGLNAAGTEVLGNTGRGVSLSQTTNCVIGGLTPSERNVISGNNSGGINILSANDNKIQGNYIGTSADGLTAKPNLSYGINTYISSGNIIGGETSSAGNVISGNLSTGIALGDNSTSGKNTTKIQNNFVGVAADGVTPLPNGSHGVGIASNTSDVLIGGDNKTFGNVIAYNNGEGISLSDVIRVAIRSNSIFSNAGLGIKYYFGNHLPPFVTQEAEFQGNTLNIQQWITLPISGNYVIDYFANEACDSSGYGEGKYYLGSKEISSLSNQGQGFPNVQFIVTDRSAKYITATVTYPNGKTFEFSRCFEATNNTLNARFDFDGDGKSDISVFRPDNGAWYLLNSSNNSFFGFSFGFGTDEIVPADYDGDGKTDIAVYRPETGTWYLQQSADGFLGVQFGQAGDIPVPADYDGDGQADIAVYRPSTGSWYRLNSSNGEFVGVAFGTAEDKPTIGDFDGDGKADIAGYRPSTGSWYRLNSSDGQFVGVPFGIATDKPVPADYDGDGKTDIAVYRDGFWYLLQSRDGFAGLHFGIATDLPVPADYDGDGKADAAVFRDGIWHLLQSSSGYGGVQFGAATDKPIPNAFIP